MLNAAWSPPVDFRADELAQDDDRAWSGAWPGRPGSGGVDVESRVQQIPPRRRHYSCSCAGSSAGAVSRVRCVVPLLSSLTCSWTRAPRTCAHLHTHVTLCPFAASDDRVAVHGRCCSGSFVATDSRRWVRTVSGNLTCRLRRFLRL
jgi:hypothetical protein